MIVEVTNLTPWERSIPTPANVSIPVKASETVTFEYPKAWDWFFEGLEDGAYNFQVELTTTPDEVTPAHPELDFTSLDEAISKANKLKVTTKVSVDGTDVYTISKWVTQEVRVTFEKAIASALRVKELADDQGKVDAAVKDLTAATTTFEGELQDGTRLYFEALREAIQEAKRAKVGIETSTDGFDIEIGTEWTTEEAATTFASAIEDANNVVATAEDQDTIDSAVETLNAAVETFNSAKSDGKLKMPVIESVGKPTPEVMALSVGSKKASELVGSDFNIRTVDHTLSVLGDLVDTKDYDAFPEESKLTDWYVPVFIDTEDGAVIKSTLLNGKEKVINVSDPDGQVLVVFAVKKDSPTRTFTIYGNDEQAQANKNGEEYTIDASRAVFSVTPSLTSVKVCEQTQSWKGVTYSSLMSPETNAVLEGNTINVTGTLYRYNGWEAFGSALQDKNYLVINFAVNAEGVTYKSSVSEGKTYTFDSDKNVDIVIPFDETHKTRDYTFFMDKDHADRNVGGVRYSVNVEGCTLESRTKEEVDEDAKPAPVLTVTASDGSKTITGNRHVNEFQSEVTVNDSDITGTLLYAEYREAFPSHEPLQTGHYLVLDLSADEEAEVQTELQGGDTVMKGLVDVDDGWCVYHITDPQTQKVRVVATRGSKVTEKLYSLASLVLQPENPVVTTSVPEDSKTFYGKRADELQSNVVVGDTEITGTLKYAEGVQIMLHEPKYQEGNFLALDFSIKPEDATIEVELQGGEPINPGLNQVDDGFCLFRITDKDTQKIHVVGTNGTQKFDKVYSLSNLVVESKKVAEVTAVDIAGQDESWKGVNYSDLMSPETAAQLEGKTIKVTGTLYKFNGSELGEGAQGKNLAVVGITVNHEGVVVKSTKLDGSEFNFTYDGKTSDDFVTPFDEDHKTRELTFYFDQDHKDRDEGGVVYTVDASQATLETKTKSEATAAAAASVQADSQPSAINLDSLDATQLKGIANELGIATTARKASTIIAKINEAAPADEDLYDAYVKVVGE